MDPCWQHLPDDLVRKILSFADIDTRLNFGIRPGKLVVPKLNLRIMKDYSIQFEDCVLYKKLDEWLDDWCYSHRIWKNGREITYRLIGNATMFTDTPYVY